MLDFVKMLNNPYNGIGDDLTHVGDEQGVVVCVVVLCAGEGKIVGEESLRKFRQGKESTLEETCRAAAAPVRASISRVWSDLNQSG